MSGSTFVYTCMEARSRSKKGREVEERRRGEKKRREEEERSNVISIGACHGE